MRLKSDNSPYKEESPSHARTTFIEPVRSNPQTAVGVRQCRGKWCYRRGERTEVDGGECPRTLRVCWGHSRPTVRLRHRPHCLTSHNTGLPAHPSRLIAPSINPLIRGLYHRLARIRCCPSLSWLPKRIHQRLLEV